MIPTVGSGNVTRMTSHVNNGPRRELDVSMRRRSGQDALQERAGVAAVPLAVKPNVVVPLAAIEPL